MAHDVFISYSSKDKTIANAICANLESVGIRCWIAPRDIGPGEDWPAAIARAITTSQVMVMVFSSDSNNSDQVYREIFLAASNKVVIIPFKIEDVELEARKQYILAGTHWLDAMNPPTQGQIDELITRVKGFIENSISNKPAIVTHIVTPPPADSLNPKIAKRIPVWARWLVIAILVLSGGAASFFLWRRTSPAISLSSPLAYPANLLKTSPLPALGLQAGQARIFAEPILAAIAKTKPDFEDKFDNLGTGWQLCDMQGKFKVEAGVSRLQVSQGGGCMWNDAGLTGKDFVLQFDTRLVSGDKTSWIGISFHQISLSQSFDLQFTPATQAWKVTGKWGHDEPDHSLAHGEDLAVSLVGEVTKITVIVRGTRFAFFLGNTPIAYFDDKNLDNNGTTFFHCNSESPAICEFDNVKFWNLIHIQGLP
jgi:hypothetical protein